jgi:regulator of cell morphogenesis and NO signaling
LNTQSDNDTLGALAARRPASMAVFERLGLDYCCGGATALADACGAAGLEPSAVLRAIDAEESASARCPEADWSGATMTELADHIEGTHHCFVRDVLSRLEILLPRVLAAHGATDPRIEELSRVFTRFAAEMRDHMVREERVLFPWLRRLERPTELHVGPPWSVQRPITCMMHDHDDAGEALARMRALSNGFTAPENACATYRSMLAMLAGLERDTHVHVHKENNILFPAGVRAEERRGPGQAQSREVAT